jgi:ParB family transcriptional regulator, chromosome partitioning protein
MPDKRPALGKGLSALIPDAPEPKSTGAMEIDVDKIEPNEYQPRHDMDDARLDELAQSIRANGIIQPIVVRRGEKDRYRIIAGERRWRAAQRAGLTRVPVVVRDVADNQQKVLEMALIENIQREDLNPIDEATAYRRLADEFHLTQDAIAGAVGKDRSTVANTLRLLRLPDEVRAEVATSRLSMGHARALLGLPDEAAQRQVGREVIAQGLSVRETEALVKKALERAAPAPPAAKEAEEPDVHTRAAEEKLRLLLGTRVRIVRKGTKGRIEIDFVSEDELIRLFEALTER